MVEVPILEKVKVAGTTKTLVLWRTGEQVPSTSLLQTLLKRDSADARAQELAYLIEWYIGPADDEDGPSPLAVLWENVIGRRSVPYKTDEHRDVLADAFRELAPEIALWERLKDKSSEDGGPR